MVNWEDIEGATGIDPTKRPGCVVCGKEQTDIEFVEVYEAVHDYFYIGFPVCDKHTLEDLKPDQYVMNNLLVEIH